MTRKDFVIAQNSSGGPFQKSSGGRLGPEREHLELNAAFLFDLQGGQVTLNPKL